MTGLALPKPEGERALGGSVLETVICLLPWLPGQHQAPRGLCGGSPIQVLIPSGFLSVKCF